eukprot:2654685-Alexandrium_andersonii.AAC.1
MALPTPWKAADALQAKRPTDLEASPGCSLPSCSAARMAWAHLLACVSSTLKACQGPKRSPRGPRPSSDPPARSGRAAPARRVQNTRARAGLCPLARRRNSRRRMAEPAGGAASAQRARGPLPACPSRARCP